ncbi:MAG: hypothetical protein GY822_30615 [Deltaproteobacteria bacterium]|nr:hypothetical protein [Deltaproteobacteria bacterium]
MAPIKISKEETMPPPSWSVSESKVDVATAEVVEFLAKLESGGFPSQHGAPASLAIPLAAPLGEAADASLKRGLLALETKDFAAALIEFDAAAVMEPDAELRRFWHQFAQYQQDRPALLRAFEYKGNMESAEKVRDREMHIATCSALF